MALPQTPEAMAASIENLASPRLGPDPTAAAAAAPPAAAPAAPMNSPTDEANTVAAPTTEDDKAGQEPLEYSVAVEIDGKGYTQKQIESMAQRYKHLNFANAQNKVKKPIYDVIERYMQANPNRSPQDIAQDLENLAKGGQSQPTLGDPNTPTNPQVAVGQPSGQSNEEVSAALKDWAKKNALDDLPPGVENLLAMNDTSTAVSGRMDSIENALAQIIPMLQGGMDAMRTKNGDADAQFEQARQQTIANNIDRAQAAYRIPDDQAPQFETWIQMIGLTLDDFTDEQDAMKYMKQFDDSLKSQDVDQLRQMTEKRLAYTGGLGSTPSAQGGPAPAAGGNDRLGRMAAKVLTSRNMPV